MSEMLDALKAQYPDVVESIANRTEQWSGDSSDDRVARAILASFRPLVDTLVAIDPEDSDINPLMFAILHQHINSLGMCLVNLDSLAKMKGS